MKRNNIYPLHFFELIKNVDSIDTFWYYNYNNVQNTVHVQYMYIIYERGEKI